MKSTTDFAYYLSTYLEKQLPGVQGNSENTIISYRDGIILFLQYMSTVEKTKPEKIEFNLITKKTIENFLLWLEKNRNCSLTTRNQRLAILHSFFKYVGAEEPKYIYLCQQILSIPVKKAAKTMPKYITLEAVKLILEMPNNTTLSGRRDLVILSLMYDTGARVQEVVDLVVSDLRLYEPETIKLTGKGNKQRIIPIMKPTANLLKQYLFENVLSTPEMNVAPLFTNNMHQKMTRAGIAYILNKYAVKAQNENPDLVPFKLTPHVFRHSRAMHLLQANVNLVYIRDLLGHVSVQTTELYARADSLMKRKALEKVQSITPSDMPIWQKDKDLLTWLKSL